MRTPPTPLDTNPVFQCLGDKYCSKARGMVQKHQRLCLKIDYFFFPSKNICQSCRNFNIGKDRPCSLLSNTVDGKLPGCLVLRNPSVVSFLACIPKLGSALMTRGINLKFTFYSEIFLYLQQVHVEVHISVHACANYYLRCTKCEVHDRVRKHVMKCTKKRVPRFLILETLVVCSTAFFSTKVRYS